MSEQARHVDSYLRGQGHRWYTDGGWTVYPLGEGDPLHGYALEIRVHRQGGVRIISRHPLAWELRFQASVPSPIIVSAVRSAIVTRFETELFR